MISPILPTYNRAPLTFERGEGSWLTATDGTRYLDFAAGIAVNVLGHAAPELVAALTAQAHKLWHTSNLYHIAEQEALAEKLVDATFADTCFFTNSGTEAAELAVKMVRKYWYVKGAPQRVRILTFEGAFHGRSSAAIAAAGSEKMVKGFGPLLPGFTQLPWGSVDAIREHIFADDIAAVMFEPVLGEGGIRPVPDADMKAIRALCDEAGVLLVLDEVQCGMGRTGKLFAHEWSGVTPDVMMVGKGIGGGFPLGALLATENAAQGMTAGTHGSTYGGNPLGCAVGGAVMDVVATPEFLGEVNRKAGLLRQGLEGLVASHPEVFEEVRGSGLMLGLKCKPPAGEMVNAGYAAQLLTVSAADNVVRLLPALNIPDEDIYEGLRRLDAIAGTLETGK
ncbi:acetylornithine/N-succinyldiaminopimelate aminotransferase [Ketogulonicigenium robustum]|uniref:Acetylornithine aminotransferase n=1 Tax=Ketogulonicigenium robustum TaxID=92947 RepID=A0A1W6P113_9RHOB|nr:aspartate aminotransferase family protein [Ketogulonicigenium robustum]ARO15139.1 acetylornithine/N-succinyldiaminopimelate aminotransferase [Ketogulonicigenium robustum]